MATKPAPEGVAMAALTDDEVTAQICVFAGRIAAITCRWLELIAEFDRRRG